MLNIFLLFVVWNVVVIPFVLLWFLDGIVGNINLSFKTYIYSVLLVFLIRGWFNISIRFKDKDGNFIDK